jgi:hypothetical protein
MISVCIFINEKMIERVDAVNVSGQVGLEYGKGIQAYETKGLAFNGVLYHNYDDGAIPLAISLLRNLEKDRDNGR